MIFLNIATAKLFRLFHFVSNKKQEIINTCKYLCGLMLLTKQTDCICVKETSMFNTCMKVVKLNANN